MKVTTSEPSESKQALVGAKPCLEAIFIDEDSRPSMRTFQDWVAKKWIPRIKIGKRVFFEIDSVRAALEEHFKIEAEGASK